MSTNNGNAEGGSPETTKTSEGDNAAYEFEPITTQEEFDKRIGARLYEERSKYKDYDELKEKATKFDEFAESQKTELEKLTEKLANAEAKNAEFEQLAQKKAWKTEARKEFELDESFDPLLDGGSLEEIKEKAKLLAESLSKKTQKPINETDRGQNKEMPDTPYSKAQNTKTGQVFL